MEDYYTLLGVTRSADQGELKKAYRSQAMKYHPDRNPGNKEAEEKFKEINEAYEILSNPEKRSMYDQYGHDAFKQQGGGGSHGFGFGANGFADIFEEMFGQFAHGAHAREQSNRGEDLRFDMTVTLEEIYEGASREVDYQHLSVCETCHGSGAAEGAKRKQCSFCHGTGAVRVQQGFFMLERTCSKCHGEGSMVEKPCTPCRGEGRRKQKKKLNVKIPKGVEAGSKMRLRGEGNAGHAGGQAGDLYVFIDVKKHEIFERHENGMLLCRVPLPMMKAVLGGVLHVPTIDGEKTEVKIPQGTQPHQKFRLKGKGMPLYNHPSYGDMIVEVDVEIPRHLSEKQLSILKGFEETLGDNNQPATSSFWEKVKKIWG